MGHPAEQRLAEPKQAIDHHWPERERVPDEDGSRVSPLLEFYPAWFCPRWMAPACTRQGQRAPQKCFTIAPSWPRPVARRLSSPQETEQMDSRLAVPFAAEHPSSAVVKRIRTASNQHHPNRGAFARAL